MIRAGSFASLLATLLLAASAAFAQPAVTGTVLGADHRPLAGARAELLRLDPAAPAPAVTAATDGAGRFVLRAPETGLLKVIVRSPESAPLQLAPLPLVEPVELPPARISPTGTADHPAPGAWAPVAASGAPPLLASAALETLSGRVVADDSRRPVAGALVWAFADPAGFVRADAEGRCCRCVSLLSSRSTRWHGPPARVRPAAVLDPRPRRSGGAAVAALRRQREGRRGPGGSLDPPGRSPGRAEVDGLGHHLGDRRCHGDARIGGADATRGS